MEPQSGESLKGCFYALQETFRVLATAIVAALMVTLAVALPGVSADGGEDKNREIDQSEDQALPLPDKTELKYPNLGSRLDQLVAGVEDGEASTREAAEDAPVHQEESVAVTIYLSGNVDGVVSFLEDNGGSPRNVGEDYIEAYVPVPLLGQVSEQFGVLRVREIVPAVEHQSTQRIAGQGPQEHGSPAWNQAGYSGQGVKVGVIDSFFGFNDFSSLMGTELPSTVQARCYTDVGRFTQNVADCAHALVGSDHGTWVAEAVMDIAPEASLYIASPRSRGDTNSAVDWMVSQGVSVIVRGEIYLFDGPGDGTSPFGDSPLKTVDRAVAGGIIWANAAGNYAQQTWFGPYSTVESEGVRFIEFHGSDIFNDMLLDAGDRITVQLRWDDSWSGARRDFNLFVWDFAAGDIVAYSLDLQGGGPGQVPSEELRYQVPSGGRYAVGVVHDSGGTPDWLQVTVWGVDSIEYYTESGSIGNPGESANPGMLAVGAAHWNDVRAIEPYSSRGPTPDGRVKPDIVGADCGATALRPLNEYNSGFCGTSQAASHVAGMAALVRQRFPDYTPAQVASYLKDNAEQRQSPDPNNTWGHGFATLPEVPTPAEHSATRSFSATTVAPEAEITVNIALSEYGRGGSVTETLPEGFTLVSGSIEFVGGGGFARPSGNQVRVVLVGAGVTNVAYKVTAPSEAGSPFEFTGKFVNFDGESVDIGGAATVTVSSVDPLVAQYDANDDGAIDIGELFSAIDDYFDGRIGISELFTIIDLYFSGPTPTATAQPPGAPTGLTATANGPGNRE